jgi:hypothetical protein
MNRHFPVIMIIDAHTHIFPDHQAASVLQATARMFNVPTYGTATAADLLARMDACGIDYSAIHMVAPVPSLVRDTNTWLIKLRQDRFIKFGTLHPHFKQFPEEIERLKDAGVRGIKFQPDVQQFTPDDRLLTYPVYEALCRHNMTVMFHVGGEPLPSPDNRSRPEMISAIARDFPELRIIGAHLGGLNMWEQVYDQLAGMANVYMETSLSYSFISPGLALNIIKKHGHKKIFFGTDYPFAPVGKSLAAARAVPFLSAADKEDILGRNAYDFFFSGES